jgi:hypothetical protein
MPPIMPPRAPGFNRTMLDGMAIKNPAFAGLSWASRISLDFLKPCVGAGSGTRTHTLLRAADFESVQDT